MSKIEELQPDDIKGKEAFPLATEWLEECGIDFTAFAAKPKSNILYVILNQEQDKKGKNNRQKLVDLGFKLGGYQEAMPEYFFFYLPLPEVCRHYRKK